MSYWQLGHIAASAWNLTCFHLPYNLMEPTTENYFKKTDYFIYTVIFLASIFVLLLLKYKRMDIGNTESDTLSNDTDSFQIGDNEEIEEIIKDLKEDLACSLSKKVNVTKKCIEIKLGEMNYKIDETKKIKEEDILVLEAKYIAEKEKIEVKYSEEIAVISEEYSRAISEMKDSIRNLSLTLSLPSLELEVMETTKSEMECPVCLEEMKPPRRIWQCSDGHPVCGNCKARPGVSSCPTCRKYLVGRSTIAEKLARALYAQEDHADDQ